MQKSNLRRLSTPAQLLPRQPSSLYRSQADGYSQRLAPLPATHGYHPQTIWVPDYRPASGGPRAVPLRMQRVTTMNQTDTRPMPIPSVQLASDRPYSVPNYHSRRISRENDGSFTRPPRPASTSEVDDIDRLIPPRQLSFARRSTAQEVELDSLTPRRNNLEAPEPRLRIPKTTRPVAKRGSKISVPDDNARKSDRSQLDLASEKDSSYLAGSQKRGIDHTTAEAHSSKRIKINVVRSQSQTPIIPEITKQSYPTTSHYFGRNNHGNDTTIETEIAKSLGVDDDETQSSDDEDDVAKPVLTSKRLGQTKTASAGKLDPYAIIDELDSFENSQDTRNSGKTRTAVNIEETNTPSDLSGGSSATHREPNISSQTSRYTNASSQCDISSKAEVKPESKPSERHHHQSTPAIGSTPSTQDAREGKVNEETLDSRLSRIEKAISAQEEGGVDEFVKTRLSTGDMNTLNTLTNEILLALVVPNDKLLEQVIKIM
ncbi:hypothetical protein F4781DRAFT_279639 [Annulohypoxylon bovei var. microspora]|nr:hypothetical protein F4781DRAFT_279639 [Annulohypoxylon bovei var. microspora]